MPTQLVVFYGEGSDLGRSPSRSSIRRGPISLRLSHFLSPCIECPFCMWRCIFPEFDMVMTV